MRIGVWISEPSSEQGGGASYECHLVKLIDEHRFPKELDIVFLSGKRNHCKQYEKPILYLSYLKPKLKENVFKILCKIAPFSKKFKRLKRHETKFRFHLSLAEFLKKKKL